ncbi:MAG TPA: alpha/beta fold hydrolase [Terriglobales bacterium]|nr:alpha/beta fold hydrolase [Terriglobales bacterium]
MIRRVLSSLFVAVFISTVFAATPAPQNVDLTAPDGVKLKATYYPAGKAGPGVLLMHQCNRDRKMWADIAPKMAEAGMNVLALDFRGFGESGGTKFDQMPPQERGQAVTQVWPKDVDVAFQYLISQKGVTKTVIGAAGASCGVNQSIQLASRHPEVKSLVLLSGNTDADGRRFLRNAKDLPLFGSAADDDGGAVEMMQWILSLSPNPANTFQRYATGGHGIEMFAPHPDLTDHVLNWFKTTLIKTPGKAPENKNASFRGASILEAIDSAGGPAKAAEMLAKAREKDPKAKPFPEAVVNLLGYEHLQSGDGKGAIEIFKLNQQAYPDSANVYDSLSDGYLADGQTDLALRNAKTALNMLEKDTTTPEATKQAIRQSAEQKIKQISSGQ